ncbi:FliH/SctL family protein [Thiomicrorhabdus sp. Kp2]|uniref:FliH/SctL family protein n=1 Tax=Thiomicrorhabdus sp. Kp2 TaxID=1123518 RepID=UPI00042622EF|nr:FliH/SctL family protein [Thiomicrorhabdus sp. Kp2]
MVDESKQTPKFEANETEPAVAKLLQSSELKAPNIETWKLSSFEEVEALNEKKLSDEAYQRIQQEMQPQIQKQAELLKQEAYDKAFEKGYQEGLLKGQEEGKRQGESEAKAEVMETLQPKLAQFDSILSTLNKPFESLEQKIYAELVGFALHVAKTVIKRDVTSDKEWVLNTIKESVLALPESSSEINIYLHPDDLAFIQISQPSISEKWSLHENSHVEVGTCIVKQDYSTILNSWIARYDDIAEQVSQDVSETDSQANHEA